MGGVGDLDDDMRATVRVERRPKSPDQSAPAAPRPAAGTPPAAAPRPRPSNRPIPPNTAPTRPAAKKKRYTSGTMMGVPRPDGGWAQVGEPATATPADERQTLERANRPGSESDDRRTKATVVGMAPIVDVAADRPPDSSPTLIHSSPSADDVPAPPATRVGHSAAPIPDAAPTQVGHQSGPRDLESTLIGHATELDSAPALADGYQPHERSPARDYTARGTSSNPPPQAAGTAQTYQAQAAHYSQPPAQGQPAAPTRHEVGGAAASEPPGAARDQRYVGSLNADDTYRSLPQATRYAHGQTAEPAPPMELNVWTYRLALVVLPLLSAGLAAVAQLRGNSLLLLTFWIPMVPAAVMYGVLLYRMWAAIDDGQSGVRPALAAALAFVPLVNLYWLIRVVAGYAPAYNGYVARHGFHAPPLGRTLLILCLLPGIGLLFLWFALGSVCRAVNALRA